MCQTWNINLLHEAIGFATSDANIYATVRLLLYAGYDSNAIDKDEALPDSESCFKSAGRSWTLPRYGVQTDGRASLL